MLDVNHIEYADLPICYTVEVYFFVPVHDPLMWFDAYFLVYNYYHTFALLFPIENACMDLSHRRILKSFFSFL